MPDDMFFSADMKSLRRGKRAAPRTETCRPCILWSEADPKARRYGVVMDVSPYGVRIRMLEALETDSDVVIQMMRDDEFDRPLARPVRGKVTRVQQKRGGFFDHGIKVIRPKVRQIVARPVRPIVPEPLEPSGGRRRALDITVGDIRRKRPGR